MPKTHQEIIYLTECELLKALTTNDKKLLRQVIHKDIVYTNENGQTFVGIENLQINDPNVLKIETLEVIDRELSIFNNIAIVNTLEKRTGKYLGLQFSGSYRLTRTWKFCGRSWILIAVSSVSI